MEHRLRHRVKGRRIVIRVWTAGECRRHVQPDLIHKCGEITRPANSNCRCAEQILEDKIPTDDPGDEFTERGIAVGIRAPGDRDHACKLRVAKSGEKASQSGYNEGDDDCRSGVLSRGSSRQHENSGADDRADAQRGEVERAERASERVFGGFTSRLSLQDSDALLRP